LQHVHWADNHDHADAADLTSSIGQFDLENKAGPPQFSMLMENNWHQILVL
jgi:hypothetical protein